MSIMTRRSRGRLRLKRLRSTTSICSQFWAEWGIIDMTARLKPRIAKAKRCMVLLAFGAPSLFGQSRVELLQQVADRFKNANSFDVKGSASAVIPGSSWRATYEFETQGAQPAFLPLSVRGPSMKVISAV